MSENILSKNLICPIYRQKNPWLNWINYLINNIAKNFPLIILISAIFLSPSFTAGRLADGRAIEIRAEDILIVILLLISLVSFLISGKRKIKKPPLFFPIIFLVGFGFFTTLINWLLGYLSIERGFFYFFKELQFILFYFYFFYHIKNINLAKFVIKLLAFLLSINIIFVFYQILGGQSYWRGEYGIAAIAEWGAFPTGAFFLLIFVFLFNVFLYYSLNLNISAWKKGFLGLVAISPVVGVFGAGSKTVLLGFIFVLIFSLLFLLLKKKKLKSIILAILVLIIVINILFFSIERINVLERYADITSLTGVIDNFEGGRLDITKKNLNTAFCQGSPLFFVLGLGKGFHSEVHNQYVRNFIEMGIIGSFLFLILIWIILKKSFLGFLKNQDGFSVGLSAGLLIATLAMLFFSFATEPFIVVKLSEVYWLFTAITMAVLQKTINKKIENKKNLIDTQVCIVN